MFRYATTYTDSSKSCGYATIFNGKSKRWSRIWMPYDKVMDEEENETPSEDSNSWTHCRYCLGNSLTNGQTQYETFIEWICFTFNEGRILISKKVAWRVVLKAQVLIWRIIAQGSYMSQTMRETTINQHEAIRSSKPRILISHLETHEYPGWVPGWPFEEGIRNLWRFCRQGS